MKARVKVKQIRELYKYRLAIPLGYCDHYEMFRDKGLEPFFYVASELYGWRCDVYVYRGYYFVTGYDTYDTKESCALAKEVFDGATDLDQVVDRISEIRRRS